MEGYKSYSYECPIFFLERYYPHNINSEELKRIDQLRKLRHDIMYRESSVAEDYLSRNETKINIIIRKLMGSLQDKNNT